LDSCGRVGSGAEADDASPTAAGAGAPIGKSLGIGERTSHHDGA